MPALRQLERLLEALRVARHGLDAVQGEAQLSGGRRVLALEVSSNRVQAPVAGVRQGRQDRRRRRPIFDRGSPDGVAGRRHAATRKSTRSSSAPRGGAVAGLRPRLAGPRPGRGSLAFDCGDAAVAGLVHGMAGSVGGLEPEPGGRRGGGARGGVLP